MRVVCSFGRVVREGLASKALSRDLNGEEGDIQHAYLGEEHSMRTNSMCKGPEAGSCFVCLGNSKEVSVADVDRVRGESGQGWGQSGSKESDHSERWGAIGDLYTEDWSMFLLLQYDRTAKNLGELLICQSYLYARWKYAFFQKCSLLFFKWTAFMG